MKRINKWIEDKGVSRDVEEVKRVKEVDVMEDKEREYKEIKYGVKEKNKEGGRRKERNVRLLDLDDK